MSTIKIIPIRDVPLIKKGDNLGELLCIKAKKQGTPIQEGDIIIVTHVVVSRSEGNVINLDKITPSKFAKNFSREFNKDPALVEVVLREAKTIIRMGDGHLITETKHGLICANGGVDKSNVPGDRKVAPLPKDPDISAMKIRQRIKKITKKNVAVIVSDTHGRALRKGEINVAIGIAGLKPIMDRRGKTDLFGYTLKVKQTAIADELSSAAELVMGQSNEGIPMALIRGYKYQKSEGSSRDLLRPKEESLFI
jgi:coenzyme F420-0:L-glutamate ligase/coenzyme F420-1:gamma-L-glutamate ligase